MLDAPSGSERGLRPAGERGVSLQLQQAYTGTTKKEKPNQNQPTQNPGAPLRKRSEVFNWSKTLRFPLLGKDSVCISNSKGRSCQFSSEIESV